MDTTVPHKKHKDSNGTNVVGRFGTDRYWIREYTGDHWDAGKFQIWMKTICYDPFDYFSPDGLSSRIGTLGPLFLTKESAEKHMAKILTKKQAIA